MNELLEYVYSLKREDFRTDLTDTERLLSFLGNPHRKFKSVHVTGTTGKGSTCAFVASILQRSGHKVGMYTSPHLIQFSERFWINGHQINKQELQRYIIHVRNVAQRQKVHPTFAEFTTALAFRYFADKGVDIAVVEVGMGGRTDPTNVLQPLVSVITNVSLDHVERLGASVEQIAAEKAGVIKKDSIFVTGEEDPKLLQFFRKTASEKGTTFLAASRDIRTHVVKATLQGQRFCVEGLMNGTYTTALLGEHQLQNAAVALGVVHALRERGVLIPSRAVKEGLKAARWRGRLEILSRDPLVIADGAHNPAGMKALARFLQQFDRGVIFVVGIARDKPVQEMISLIAPFATKMIVTEGSFKPTPADDVAKAARRYTKPVVRCSSVPSAIHEALSSVRGNEIMVVTGSLYLVGDVLGSFERIKLRHGHKSQENR